MLKLLDENHYDGQASLRSNIEFAINRPLLIALAAINKKMLIFTLADYFETRKEIRDKFPDSLMDAITFEVNDILKTAFLNKKEMQLFLEMLEKTMWDIIRDNENQKAWEKLKWD